MKRCPECGRNYDDDSMSFCRDDGAELLFGPSSMDEPATKILSTPGDVANGLAHPTDEKVSKTAILQQPVGEGVSDSTRRFDKRLFFAPLALGILVLGGFLGYRYFTPAKQIESIAVMPFVNESGNEDVEYLSDGMTETLIGSLTQLPNLNVKARSSVFRYKGKETDTKTIGKELNVQAILTGRVAQRGDQLTLSLELVDVATENAIWSQRYDRKQSGLVALQSEIAKDVSTKIKLKLSGADEAKVTKASTANSEAYRLYLQGRFHWNKREEKELRLAIGFLSRAVTLDPNYALAYAGLADTHALLFGFDFEPITAVAKAREFATKAATLDGSLAEPYATLALTSQYLYDYDGAEQDFKRSIELTPNYPTVHQWYGEMLTCLGRSDEALAEHRRSLDLDPLSLPLNWAYGRALYFARRLDESVAQLKKTAELDPNFARTHRTLAELYRLKKDYAASVEERAKFAELTDNQPAAALIREAFAKEGWIGYLRLVVSEPGKLKENNWMRAKAYVELGKKDEAFAELEKAYELRATSLLWSKIEPGMDPIRDDPRYQDLLKRINLAE